jgi:Ca2+-dependent lipid-binding protein
MATSGTLEVTIVEARLVRDTETFGTQDPYITIEHRMQKFKSKVASDGGKEPKFEETFLFEVKYIGDDFTMKIMNKNMMLNDDTLGEATIKISGLCLPGGMDDWWKLQYKGKDGGAIRFKTMWHPKKTQADEDLTEKDAEIERLKQEGFQQ